MAENQHNPATESDHISTQLRIESRIVALEKGQESLIHQIQDLTDNIHEQIRQFHESVRSIRDEISSLKAPNWNVLISGVGLILAFATAAGSAAMAPLYFRTERQRDDLAEVRQALTAHMELPGHAQTIARLTGAENELEKQRHATVLEASRLDNVFQRELAALEKSHAQRFDAMNSAWQRETERHETTLDTQLQSIQSAIQSVERRLAECMHRVDPK